MKVAIIHDWLTGMRGGEKVLEALCELFPQAEIFTLVHTKGALSSTIEQRPIHTSFLQHLPSIEVYYRNYLPLFPLAIESFNLKGFDLIISSSHCVAKAIHKPKNLLHICYCYTPMRYAWKFFDEYFSSYPLWKRLIVACVVWDLKRWDLATLNRVDDFIAISQTVRERIRHIYQREATIIHPPVEVEAFAFSLGTKREDFYLCVSALVPYKRLDILVEAFNRMHDKKIIIVGDGHLRKDLEGRKRSKNIQFLGWVRQADLIELYQKARAFVYPAEEDFGIAPVEAQATGLAVVAYGKGGVSETVVPLDGEFKTQYPTGLFFLTQNCESLIEAIERFEKYEQMFSPQHIREHALKFSRNNFKKNIVEFIQAKLGAL